MMKAQQNYIYIFGQMNLAGFEHSFEQTNFECVLNTLNNMKEL